MSEPVYNVALTGNPNVGKSTIFNSFTGMHQHTGNWTGKTVENAKGEYRFHGASYTIIDLPGTYSLNPSSAEEEAACGYIQKGLCDVLVIVLDAVCPERNLRFAAELISRSKAPVIVCLNLIDEAEKKGIFIDDRKMSEMLGAPVVTAAARSGRGLDELKTQIERAAKAGKTPCSVCSHCSSECCRSAALRKASDPGELAAGIMKECVKKGEGSDEFDRRVDRVILSKAFGIPIMLLLMLLIFWITIVGANYPSQLLSRFFSWLGVKLRLLLDSAGCPGGLESALIDGVYTTLSWVVAVMLPPMAIFFPLFTLLEDLGYLPRVAFNLDTCFRCAGAHGKQSLTTAMGFGCNACAVTGCRIIDSKRERLIAILTNSLIPCNGRFPMIIALISVFLCPAGGGALSALIRAAVLTLFIVLSVLVSLAASKLLSKTVLRGVGSSFVLELPPYRRPQIGRVIVRSLFDRTVFVLLRAVAVAAPAGLVIWLLANVSVGGSPLIEHFTSFLDPFAVLIGLDGAILAAFILGFPANEIVLPIALMIYLSQQTLSEVPDLASLSALLSLHGWTSVTAVCVIVFSMFHFPCSTTCLTIYKETKSLRWTALSMVLPFLIGCVLCAVITFINSF